MHEAETVARMPPGEAIFDQPIEQIAGLNRLLPVRTRFVCQRVGGLVEGHHAAVVQRIGRQPGKRLAVVGGR